MTSLRKAQIDGSLEKFIQEHEPLDAPKEAVKRYIDASATPLGSHKEGQSKSNPDFSDDCK